MFGIEQPAYRTAEELVAAAVESVIEPPSIFWAARIKVFKGWGKRKFPWFRKTAETRWMQAIHFGQSGENCIILLPDQDKGMIGILMPGYKDVFEMVQPSDYTQRARSAGDGLDNRFVGMGQESGALRWIEDLLPNGHRFKRQDT